MLRLDIDDAAYGALTVQYLDGVTGPALTAAIYAANQQDTYVDGNCDVIEAPIMGRTSRMQQKFESAAAQDVLNASFTVRTVSP